MNLSIGSGDIKSLLMGKQTKGYQNLLRNFVSDKKPYYNAYASPIDALRTGAIMENIYIELLPDGYYTQVKVRSKEMDVFKSSLDFAKMEKGKVIDFDELKTIWLTDFIDIVKPLTELKPKEAQKVISKKFKGYYNQVQQQLYTTELDSCNLVFLAVTSYDDDFNKKRVIKQNEVIKFRIFKDEKVIQKIKEAGKIFQIIKDNFKNEKR